MTSLHGSDLSRSFGAVAADYQAARPTYPQSLFDAIEELSGNPLKGARALDVGAGTGIATRLLRGRGAEVVAVEPTPGMAAQLHAASPDIPLVRADGHALPFADGSADLVTYAQAFHWTTPATSVPEARRVLRPGGALALFWNLKDRTHGWAGDQQRRIIAACPQYHGDNATFTSGADLAALGMPTRTALLHWSRRIPVDTAVADLRSRSYVAVLEPGYQAEVLAAERVALLAAFPDGEVVDEFGLHLTVGLNRSA